MLKISFEKVITDGWVAGAHGTIGTTPVCVAGFIIDRPLLPVNRAPSVFDPKGDFLEPFLGLRGRAVD
ncbi:MAG: hypothetical protein MN733_28845, partial [Nitrososphaera sp.]|nr:hypothetical protein [Nitrososphaera sp.]